MWSLNCYAAFLKLVPLGFEDSQCHACCCSKALPALVSLLSPVPSTSSGAPEGAALGSSLVVSDAIPRRSLWFVPCGHRSRSPQAGWLKTMHVYFSQFRGRSFSAAKSRCWLDPTPSGGSREKQFLPVLAPGGLWLHHQYVPQWVTGPPHLKRMLVRCIRVTCRIFFS